MIDTRSDQERAAPIRATMPRPHLTCPGHVWGGWMIDMLTVKTPAGNVYLPQPVGYYRRFCTRKGCKGEQKGRGSACGNNVKVIE